MLATPGSIEALGERALAAGDGRIFACVVEPIIDLLLEHSLDLGVLAQSCMTFLIGSFLADRVE